MADEKKSFSELVSAAPLAAAEDTINLVGALQRSHQKNKFVLVLGSGRSVTLEIDAVKDYRVLGGLVGQSLVQVDLDRKRVPRELTEAQPVAGGASPAIGAVAPFAIATPHHAPLGLEAGTQAWLGGVNVFGPPPKSPWGDGTVYYWDQPSPKPPWGDGTAYYWDQPVHTRPIVDAGATGVPPNLD
jgi:hypothetical protein